MPLTTTPILLDQLGPLERSGPEVDERPLDKEIVRKLTRERPNQRAPLLAEFLAGLSGRAIRAQSVQGRLHFRRSRTGVEILRPKRLWSETN